MPPASAGAERPGGPRRGLASGARPRVLVIDDHVVSDAGLGTLVKLLGLSGLDVVCVETAGEGLRLALTDMYDVIVLDLRLPDRPGLEVLEAIRASGRDAPVIVLTGWYLDDGHEHAARALGVHDYLHKPVYADDLAPLLWQAIGGRDVPTGRPPSAREGAPPPVGFPPVGVDVRNETGRYGPDVDELVSWYLPWLRRVLRAKYPRVSDDFVTEAIDGALLDWLDQTAVARSPDEGVRSFLSVAARRNLRDILRSETRRQHREIQYATEAPQVGEAPEVAFARESRDLQQRLRALASNPAEERALVLWIDGATVDELAEALGCSDRPAIEQRAEVKRFKDRIRQRARRLGLAR